MLVTSLLACFLVSADYGFVAMMAVVLSISTA
jgi:hypothetical protein